MRRIASTGGLSRLGGFILALAVLLCAPAQPSRAQTPDPLALMEQINTLARDGKFDEAIEVSKRLLVVMHRMAGKAHPIYFAQMAGLADLYALSGNNGEAEKLHLQALALRERILGAEHKDVAASLASLANVYINTARFDEAEAALQRCLQIRRKALPESDPDYGFTYVALGRIHMARSRFADAEEAFRTARDLLMRHLPADHMFLPVVANNLAEAHRALGQFADAEKLLREALAEAERIHGADTQFTAPMLNNLAQLHRSQGRFPEAETLMRRELAITEKARGPEHISVSISLNNLGTLMAQRGRPKEAVALINRALVIVEKAYGPDHPDVAKTLNNLADAMAATGAEAEAERLFRRSLSIREKTAGPDDLSVAVALDNLVVLLDRQKRHAEAEPVGRRAVAIRSANQAADHPDLAFSIGNLASVLDQTGRHDEALPLHERAIGIRKASLGGQHPDLAVSLSNLGNNRIDKGDWRGAHDNFTQASQIWVSRRAALAKAASGTGDLDSELKRFADPFIGLVWAAYELQQGAAPAERQALSEEAFAAMQWASLTSAASAVSKMSARIAAGSGDLSTLAREQQDLSAELEALDQSLIAAISTATAARSREAEADLRNRIEKAQGRLAAITGDLSTRFPEFAALASAEPKTIAGIRAALRPDEALYSVLLTRGGGFAFVMTAQTERWVRIGRTHQQIEKDVEALRCELDIAAWSADTSRCTELGGALNAKGLPRFDLERAHGLYSSLFGEVEDLVKGRHLILVPSGALTQLPFQALVTQKPDALAGNGKAAWLARQNAITVLPAIGSLDALRKRGASDASRQPYFGMGNPLLNGPDARYGKLAEQARAKQTCAASPTLALAQPAGLSRSPMRAEGLVEPNFLRGQPPLPETADELCAVARDIGASADTVKLGRNATEAGIKQLSGDGQLQRYRVLHFATHGAMVGEVAGSSEPGLILTPPVTASEADDGYLSASEIALLRLDADLVILSACNTAAGGAVESETLSGLARAFIYAQARALLVSHWAVDSEATVKLITAAMRELARDKTAGPAEALRRAMLALIDSGAEQEAHPAFWAPFIVVGDGAR